MIVTTHHPVENTTGISTPPDKINALYNVYKATWASAKADEKCRKYL